jgi:hypothetical protein
MTKTTFFETQGTRKESLSGERLFKVSMVAQQISQFDFLDPPGSFEFCDY